MVPGGTGAAGAAGAAGSTGAGGAATGGAGGCSPIPHPGLLTAGTWDDNLNFDFYRSYLERVGSEQAPGLPLIPRANRLEIRVSDGAGGDRRREVTISGAAGQLLEAPTRSDGRLFFSRGGRGASRRRAPDCGHGRVATATATGVGDAAVSVAVAGVGRAPAGAGSRAGHRHDGKHGGRDRLPESRGPRHRGAHRRRLPQRRAALGADPVSRRGRQYVVRSFDFTDSLSTFQSQLAAQSAGGGGDYPEAPEQALAKLTTLTFSQNAAARMAFWIADAPHHDGREGTMVADILPAQRLGIHLYPIAASGPTTWWSTRCAPPRR